MPLIAGFGMLIHTKSRRTKKNTGTDRQNSAPTGTPYQRKKYSFSPFLQGSALLEKTPILLSPKQSVMKIAF